MAKKRSGAYAKNKGNAYERQLVNELKEITGNDNLIPSRMVDKKLDNMKIDVFDKDNVLPCYIQAKKTQNTPSVKKINKAVGLKDKPLCIIWNVQEKKEGNVNITSAGEYAIIPKSLFYDLIKSHINKSKHSALINVMMEFISDMPTGYEPLQEWLDVSEETLYEMIEDLKEDY